MNFYENPSSNLGRKLADERWKMMKNPHHFSESG
jgi:hypothetical protein